MPFRPRPSFLAGVFVLWLAGQAGADRLSTPAGDLSYEVRGEGCPLVLVGGGSAMDARQWQPVADLLAERFQVISFDPRGIGGSQNPQAPYSDADDMATLLDHLEIPAAIFAGGSAAGGAVLETALAHPERVIGTLAVAPLLAGFPPSPEMAERMKTFSAAVQAGGDAFVETVRHDPHFLPAPERPEAREAAWPWIRETFARERGDATLAKDPRSRPSSAWVKTCRPCCWPSVSSTTPTSSAAWRPSRPPCPAPSG